MKTSAVPAQVTNTLAQAADELRDIKPPVAIATWWPWIIAGIVLVALAILAWVAWFLWRNRTSTPPTLPTIPPDERARQKLQAAFDLIDQPEPFCVLVSDAVRVYLEERLGLRAPERTTDEFLLELSGSNSLTDTQKESLQQFLTACDLVKFARHQPGRTELHELQTSALRLIEETELSLNTPSLATAPESTPPDVPTPSALRTPHSALK